MTTSVDISLTLSIHFGPQLFWLSAKFIANNSSQHAYLYHFSALVLPAMFRSVFNFHRHVSRMSIQKGVRKSTHVQILRGQINPEYPFIEGRL